ncbi:MAG: Radial spoke head protein 3, variant 2, partial [Marteilia pararefringens]
KLFDFDKETKSLIENLFGKVMGKAKVKLFDEEELRNIEAYSRLHLDKKQIQFVVMKRLQEAERRRVNEIVINKIYRIIH